MSACLKCANLGFHILVNFDQKEQANHAKYVDECPFYMDMVMKIMHKNECPHFIDKDWEENDELSEIDEEETKEED